MNIRKKFRMMTPERIGLLALCFAFAFLLIAILISQRDCSGAETRARAEATVDSLCHADTIVPHPHKRQARKKTSAPVKNTPYKRSHLDEELQQQR